MTTAIATQEIKKGKFIKNIFKALGLSGVAVGGISIFYLIQGNLTFDGRLRAFYRSANHLGMYLAPCLLAYLGT
ncbi:MAG TPA: hypothetical protein VKO42_04695, partial [Patescibacteria group bacterium]|nr:hypothetical protein [Patescibacteria group bacterium]